VVLAEIEDRHDIRVVQRAGRAGFRLEAGAALGILGDPGGQDLQGHVTGEARVAGAVHLTHAARAERRKDLVWA
jgi:hypothetical protein